MSWDAEPMKKPSIRRVKFPLEFSGDKTQHPASPPEVSEHNVEFLKPLGYDEKKLAGFRERSVA
ncbi:MAG: hypothetical protein HYV01_23885 [Deltaproteobacteria bacterium]|nr:hypothetical protein [Deltaproteobacteria bacterium]